MESHVAILAESTTPQLANSMARDRNTMAKRMREAEKRRKADEKRNRRLEKKDQANLSHPSPSSESTLTSSERSVLALFREYLMTPGKMLCINSPKLEQLNEPLKQLTKRGLLNSEQRHGGYSLTEKGYQTMTATGG